MGAPTPEDNPPSYISAPSPSAPSLAVLEEEHAASAAPAGPPVGDKGSPGGKGKAGPPVGGKGNDKGKGKGKSNFPVIEIENRTKYSYEKQAPRKIEKHVPTLQDSLKQIAALGDTQSVSCAACWILMY